MDPIQIALAISILLCSLVAGIVLAFAIIIMPGIGTLGDRDFLRAFKVMDRVIQNNHPTFLMVWLGSAVAIMALGVLSIWHLDSWNRILAIILSVSYLLGVQLPTITINIPLNNRVQSLDLDHLDESVVADERKKFEPRWLLWNSIRTVVATVVTTGLIVVALRV